MIFNIVVNEVVRAVLAEVCGMQEEQHCLGWKAGETTLVFYADTSWIAARDHIWVQDELLVMVGMLRIVGIET